MKHPVLIFVQKTAYFAYFRKRDLGLLIKKKEIKVITNRNENRLHLKITKTSSYETVPTQRIATLFG